MDTELSFFTGAEAVLFLDFCMIQKRNISRNQEKKEKKEKKVRLSLSVGS